MDVYEAMARRRTAREFSSAPVPEEAVRRVLAAGLTAPSNAPLKPWQFVLLRDRERRRRAVVEGQLTMMLEAPELLVVCYRAKPLAECRSAF